MTWWVPSVLVVVCAAAAGWLTLAWGAAPRARSMWWAASIAAGAAAGLGSLGPTPVAVALAGVGLAAAAVIDAVEGRIPPALAHGTTAASGTALVLEAWRDARVGVVATAAGLTAGLVVFFAVLWLAGRVGYGDVRLAASTVTASVAGLPGTITLLGGASLAAGITAAVQRHRGRQVPLAAAAPVPFAPALAAGWLLAVVTT